MIQSIMLKLKTPMISAIKRQKLKIFKKKKFSVSGVILHKVISFQPFLQQMLSNIVKFKQQNAFSAFYFFFNPLVIKLFLLKLNSLKT